MNTAETTESFWGEVLSTYTRDQAVADGILIPLSTLGDNIAGMGAELGITVPIYLTNTLFSGRINKRGADIAGRIWDVLWMYRVRVSGGMQLRQTGRTSGTLVLGTPRPERITEYQVMVGRRWLRLWGVLDVDALTIMFPEDY